MTEQYPRTSLGVLTDQELKSRLQDLSRQERENVADIVEHIMEVDRREAALDWGYSSLFSYCVQSLGFTEQAAYSRIRAARAAAKFPDLIERLRSGRLHLDAVARLSPYLTPQNNGALPRLAADVDAYNYVRT